MNKNIMFLYFNVQVILQVLLEVGWHKLLQEEVLHAAQTTGKPRFFPEVPSVMLCGVWMNQFHHDSNFVAML